MCEILLANGWNIEGIILAGFLVGVFTGNVIHFLAYMFFPNYPYLWKKPNL